MASPSASKPARTSADAVEREVARFGRRVRLGTALLGFADGAVVSAVAYAASVLVARTLGSALAPGAWLAAFAVPPVLLASVRAARTSMAPRALAAHLDRRAGAASLLLGARERDASAWHGEVREALRAARLARPAPRWSRILPRVAVAGLVAGAVLLLPPPDAAAVPPHNPLLVDALDRFEERLDLLREQGMVDAKEAEELERRAAEVEERTQKGERAEWADVDSLAEALERAREEAVSNLARALESADALAGADAKDDAGAAQAAREAFARAEAAGLREALPEEWAKRMGEKGDDGAATRDGLDAASRAALSEAMREAASDRLEEWARSGALDPGEATDLRDLVEAMRRDGRCPECDGKGEPCAACAGCEESKDGKPCGACGSCRARAGRPGRGGVTRGRGDADLGLLGRTDGTTEGLEAKRLPPDARPGPTWTRLGTSRAEPRTEPVREAASGGPADAGVGDAAWSRRLAPRDRGVVRRFFGESPPSGSGGAEEGRGDAPTDPPPR